MSSKRTGPPSKKAERIKEQAYKRLAKKKPEVLTKPSSKVEAESKKWPYVLMMLLGLVLLFIGSALYNWAIVIAAMIISFYGTMRYSYLVAKTKASETKTSKKITTKGPKILGEEKLD